MSARLLSLCAAFTLVACLPEPDPAGRYGCTDEDDTQCPDGFECRSDDRCYGPDEPGFAIYAPCSSTDDCDVGLTCTKIDTASVGTCTQSCATATTCPANASGETSACGNVSMGVSACFESCDTDDDCPTTHECLVVPMTMGAHACYATPPSWTSAISCTAASPQCPPSMMCSIDPAFGTLGICTYPCGMMGEVCPGTMAEGPFTECAALGSVTNATPSDFGCLRVCQPNASCGNADMVCAKIAGSSSPNMYCIPPGWAQ